MCAALLASSGIICNLLCPSRPTLAVALGGDLRHFRVYIDLFAAVLKHDFHRRLIGDPPLGPGRLQSRYEPVQRLCERVMFATVNLGEGGFVAGIDARAKLASAPRLRNHAIQEAL